MIHDHLTDYQIAESFGDTLSIIYKAKCEELNNNLTPYYNHIDKFDCPQYTNFERECARGFASIIGFTQRDLKAIEHIQKIRSIYRKMKKEPEGERLNIEKARNIPIESLYDFRRKGKNVSCPFHGIDSHPSASIKYNYFVCFTCSIKLDVIGFFMKINDGMKFKEAVEELNKL